ncbi:MAG: hypothetical protein O3A00_18385 [Planctomycetota bacterium]|nr:hypothetical protein [Planctomycetota bacterium]
MTGSTCDECFAPEYDVLLNPAGQRAYVTTQPPIRPQSFIGQQFRFL